MADNEEGDGTAPGGGNEWEVLTLTASAYAAAPGPKQVDSVHDSQGKLGGEYEAEVSNDMVYSRHFIFPPSQHENLPLEPEYSEKKDVKGGDTDASELIEKEEGKSDLKDEENVSFREFLPDGLSASGADLDNVVVFDKEKSNSSSFGFLSSEYEATMGKTNTDEDDEKTDDNLLPQNDASDSGSLDSQKLVKGGKYDGSHLPCEAWWKRRAVGLYAQAKETNTLWSIFIAAAVMGLVIIGHQWQGRKVASFAPQVAVRYQ